jgi:hypothetical protein
MRWWTKLKHWADIFVEGKIETMKPSVKIADFQPRCEPEALDTAVLSTRLRSSVYLLLIKSTFVSFIYIYIYIYT